MSSSINTSQVFIYSIIIIDISHADKILRGIFKFGGLSVAEVATMTASATYRTSCK